MIRNLFSKNKEKLNSIDAVSAKMRKYVDEIREEFDEHLDSINENTNEIQSNYEYMCALDSKIGKLSERIDEVQMLLKQIVKERQLTDGKKQFFVQPLTVQEKEIFMTLYTENDPVHYSYISQKLNFTETLVQQYITNLIEKGIPVIKEYRNGKAFISINKEFKEFQAKENVLVIDRRKSTLQI